jgi:hypothetical protein
MNSVYRSLFTAVEKPSSGGINVELGHYPGGPTLQVLCCGFEPSYGHQVRVLKKDSLGWHATPTTAYCVTKYNSKFLDYVRACIPYVLHDICEGTDPVCGFFKIARCHLDVSDCVLSGRTLADIPSQVSIIRDCLELYTCLRLLFIGWQFHGYETLGMQMVGDPASAWYGRIPVPRMVQNQLGHQLELRMIGLDSKILSALHILLKKRDRSLWVVTTLTVFFLLHVRELDGARNIFWKRYKDVVS